LLGKKRAIVTNIAGTTRDSIEAGVYRAHHYWTLIDTAGIRQTDDVIEQEGINRSFEQAALADIILLVFDSSNTMTAQEQQVYTDLFAAHKNKIIVVGNKADLQQISTIALKPDISVSSATNSNIGALEILIEEKINTLFAHADSPFLLNTRQFNLIQSLEKKLINAQEQFTDAIAYELLSIHLNDALACLSELTGKDVSEQAMDAIFKEFCIGK
jgi:tRNA modification GTPase